MGIRSSRSGAGAGLGVFRSPPLSWGCEFVDAVRSDTLWNKAKDNIIKPASSFSFGVLRDWLKAEIAQGFPTTRG